MDELWAKLEPYLDQLQNLVLVVPFAVTALLCIGAGAAAKRAQFFPDQQIPFWLGMLGGVAYPLIAWQMNQDYRSGLWALNAAIGLVTGFSSVGIHQMIRNSPFLSKLPILKLLVPPTGGTEINEKKP